MSRDEAHEEGPGGPQGRSLEPSGEVEQLLAALAAGAGAPRERLLELVYGELRRQADGLLGRERREHTLQPTALVHEAWLRLAAQDRVDYYSRRHFLAIASQAMRRVLVDHARLRATAKRGEGWDRVTLGGLSAADADDRLELLALEEALARLERESPRRARVVELLWFGGCTAEQAAQVLDVSARTIGADWRYARAWLYAQLERPEQEQ
ncbi:MAG: ECF-type sigma factor [Planctomycetota bacterium]